MFIALLYLDLAPVFLMYSLFGPTGWYIGHIASIFSLHFAISFVLALSFHFSHGQFKMMAKELLLLDAALPLSLILLSVLAIYVVEATGVFFLGVLIILGFTGLIGLVNKFFGKRFLEWIRIEHPSDETSKTA